MVDVLQIVSVVLSVFALVPALAHALELPGKLRLTKDAYFAVQPIYYPGFTILGFSEPVAIVAAIALLILVPVGTTDFWLTLAALLALVSMHAVYWLFTHPLNNFWLEGKQLSGLGYSFFSLGSAGRRGGRKKSSGDWTALRDRWEYSHVARALLAGVSFFALLVASSAVGDG
jgi:hypothetical protein